MAIAFDNETLNNQNNAASPATFSHTTAGSNRGLLVIVNYNNNSIAPSVTYAGVSMTQNVIQGPSAQRSMAIFSLSNPTIGANNVVVSYSGTSNEINIVAISYTGVDQTTMVDATNSGSFSGSTTPSLSVTTVTANSWVFVGGVGRNGLNDWTPDSPSVQRYKTTDFSAGVQSNGADRTTTTTGSYTVSFTTASEQGPLGGVAIKPASAAVINGNFLMFM